MAAIDAAFADPTRTELRAAFMLGNDWSEKVLQWDPPDRRIRTGFYRWSNGPAADLEMTRAGWRRVAAEPASMVVYRARVNMSEPARWKFRPRQDRDPLGQRGWPVSFRREKLIEQRPRRGRRGRGGDVVVEVVEGLNTLIDPVPAAPSPERPFGWAAHRASGADIVLRVPVGTEIPRGPGTVVAD